jgi:adenine-specific DNA-methyltransferase
MSKKINSLGDDLASLNEHELRRLVVEMRSRQKLGLVWESNAIERDRSLNNDVVLPRLNAALSVRAQGRPQSAPYDNLIIEGDNFDALRLLRTTHANKIRVILIDPPYNTGNKDWVYNDHYVGKNDRWRHSQWLEFLYQRLTLARDLLTSDGVMLVCINDENRSRLELLMDEVLPGRRLGSMVWRTKDTGNDLSQRFSHVHEHVLVYGNSKFKFNGRATDKSKFRNPDDDPRGDWSPQPLTKAHTFTDRENTFYPIQNPETGYWYPCDPDSVWRFASEQVLRKLTNGDEAAYQTALSGLRSDTMEQLIAKKLIYFPPCKPEDVQRYDSKKELIAAIRAGTGPALPKKKTPLLREDLPDLDFWVGKPIASGRPSRKELWNARPEFERTAPFCSWIAGVNEEIGDEESELYAPQVMRSTRGGVATDEIKSILGSKAFPHPKPMSLIQGLLEQATRAGDIVLDFFAGSATTAHAVLALNAQDGGQRRFILCSSSEITAKEPDKNLCRDVCAERVRRVIAGYGDTKGLPGDFAYITLDKLDPADARLDADDEQAHLLLAMRQTLCALSPQDGPLKIISANEDLAAVYLPKVNEAAIKALLALEQPRLAVYSSRPQTVAERLSSSHKTGNSYAIGDVIMAGQARNPAGVAA